MASVPDTSKNSDNPTTNSSPKDFVEHLRTIHFTLLIVSLTLVVIVLSPSSSAIRKANEQLNEIAEVTTVWDTFVVYDALNAEMKGRCKEVPFKPFNMKIGSTEVTFEFEGPNWGLYGAPPGFSQDGDFQYIEAPKTLAAFREIWDANTRLFCPNVLRDEVWVSESEVHPESGVQRLPLKKLPIKEADETIVLKLVSNRQWFDLPDDADEKHLSYEAVDSDGQIGIPVGDEGDNWLFLLRDQLIKTYTKYPWRHTDFADAFRELDEGTNGFQDLDFDHLKNVLRLQEKNSQDTFQAFGVRFPIETTSRWGLLILLAIQLYFWMHLAQFRSRGFSKSDVAWIGCYSEWLPRILFLLTAVVVPVGVVIFLLFFQRETPFHNRVLSDLALALTAILAGLSGYEHKRFSPAAISKTEAASANS